MEMHTRESMMRTHGIESPPYSYFGPIRRWLTQFLRGLWEQHRRASLIRRQAWKLQRSDDRILRDIGISRWEIETVVRGGRSAAGGNESPGK